MRAPISYVHDNLVFGRDRADAWALYELAGVAYPYLARAGKLELFARVEALLYRLESDVQLLRVSRAFSVDAYLAGACAVADPRHVQADLLNVQLEHDRRALAARPTADPELYLAVALAPSMGEGLAGLWRAFAARLSLCDARALSERALRELQAAERRTFERVDAFLEAERASTEQVQWLVRRAYTRGLAAPATDARHRPQALELLDGDGARAWRPAHVDVHRWHDALLERDMRTLRAHTEHGVSHQAQLVLGALPEETRFPGEAELLFAPLERLPFAVDACLHARWLPNRDAVALARRRRTDAENAFEEEASGVGAPSSEAIERPAAARELEHRLTRPDRPPLLRAAAVLSIGAPDAATLAERVERVRIEYGGIALHRPHGEQHSLFLSTLPAQRMPLDDYADYLLLEQVAATMPVAVDAAGSELGPYLGHTLSAARRPVCLDLAEACRDSRAPTVLLLGTLGSGKTVAMEALAYRAWTLGSGPVVDIDPKGDHRWEALPGVRAGGPDANLEVVELSAADRYRGLLDPLRIGEPGAREDLAHGFLAAILPQPVPAEWQTELRLAVQRAAADGAGTCAAVLALLADGPPAACDCARALAVHAGAGLARLGFADPDRPPPDVGGRDIVSLRIRHLRLPPPGRARGDADEEERVGTALLRLLAAYALRLTATDTERHSIVCIDEAWALLEHAPEVVERLSRLGRSQNATPMLASQLVGDAGALAGLVGTCLVFGLDSDAEAAAALRLLRQDPGDESLRRRLLAFRRGRCLLLDAHGRTTALQVELTDPALLAALDTTPGPAAAPAPHAEAPAS
ncbi:MAG TPA: ATP-binding protein [Conexibacter sp.]